MMAPDADPWGNGKFMDIEEASNGKIKDLAMDCKVEEPKFENGEAVEVRWSVTDDWTPGKFIGMNDDLFVVRTAKGFSSYSICRKKKANEQSI